VSGDVLGDGGEVGACVGAAGDEIGFAGVLVGELAGIANDPAEVGVRGLCKRVVPTEGRESVLGSSLIGEFEESMLVG
jgi:hypothetical protein